MRRAAIGAVCALVLASATVTSSAAARDAGDEPGLPEFAKNYVPTGPLIADNGFNPQRDGFSFENYANDAKTTNLTPASMVGLFGTAVCADGNDATDCVLIPTAQEWMSVWNTNMDNGHCMGLAVSAELFYASLGQPARPAAFGSTRVSGLQLDANAPLQSHIARGYAYQGLDSVMDNTIKARPSVILARLKAALDSGDELFTIGIFERDGTGGHAITPYAIEQRGGGRFRVLVYDNNMPLITRAMDIDTWNETWSYEASPIPTLLPDLYEGDAKTQTLWLLPTTPALAQQPCPFCGDAVGSLKAADEASERTLYWTGDTTDARHSDIVITDDRGRRSGCGLVDGHYRCVNEIPGVTTQQLLLDQQGIAVWEQSAPPSFTLPERAVAVEVQGRQAGEPQSEGIHVIGSGISMAVEGLQVARGDTDRVRISKSGQSFGYQPSPDSGSRPVFSIGVNGPDVSYELELTPTAITGGDWSRFTVLPGTQQLVVRAGSISAATYAMTVRRVTAEGNVETELPPFEIGAGEALTIDYGNIG